MAQNTHCHGIVVSTSCRRYDGDGLLENGGQLIVGQLRRQALIQSEAIGRLFGRDVLPVVPKRGCHRQVVEQGGSGPLGRGYRCRSQMFGDALDRKSVV